MLEDNNSVRSKIVSWNSFFPEIVFPVFTKYNLIMNGKSGHQAILACEQERIIA
ncbi:MAG: hypothetical protein BWY09_00212 [Candidatus Hydrogenedentes bacterium ADurb.Bin179]|nr:MAG: hypothetical protein BWY09_00212 [Candidatus Hydrogenedentes bacterium ADurb.Bin179]